MKTQKIGVISVSLLMLAVFVVPCVAQNASEKKNVEPVQKNNAETVQNQGEEEKIQNQTTEQTEAGQNINSVNDVEKNGNENKTGANWTENQNEVGDDENLENGQKAQNQIKQNQENQGEERRSRVANAVQEMLAVADRNPAIGQQIRVVAQNQNQEQEEMEGALQTAKKRSGITKFLIGPNYKELKKVGDRLENHKNHLKELKGLRDQLGDNVDAEVLARQIQAMEQIGAELENEVNQEKQGMSLFGWLFRWMAKQ